MLKILSSCLLALIFAALSGCTRTEQERSGSQISADTTRPSQILRIGLVPEQNIFKQMERYDLLVQYLSKKTGVNVQFKILLRYGNIIDNFVSEGLDGAFFGSFTYALAHEKMGVRVVVRPEHPDGRSTYYGMIIVRKDSGIRTIGDMRGKRFAFVDKATTAGYVLPYAYFRRHGVDYRTYLRESYFAGTHEHVITDVLDRKADIGAVKNTVFALLASKNRRIAQELQMLERSPEVPENALAFRKDLDPKIVNAITTALLTMDHDVAGKDLLREFGARRFIVTTDDDYLPVYQYAQQAGISLLTYDYMND
jgi:phosphonate transport system substrate-binding protein